jgi:hypothetical protein
MAAEEIARAASALLGCEVHIESAAQGGNSRVYIARSQGRRLALKQYFRHGSDERDRLQAERAFLEFAAAAGIACVPKVIASDREQGFGVYEYVAGRPLGAGDITAARVQEAARFFRALNEHREAARALPSASEAAFSVEEHLRLVDRRVERLTDIADPAAQRFSTALARRWSEVRSRIAARAASLDADFERCVSPSDFGFHNALLRDSGELCFLDFEYAGWDDPAKMLCDFFTHPALPVPSEYFADFAAHTMGFSAHAAALLARAQALLPLFQLKWCCIMLNEFVPGAAERRRFARPAQDEVAVRARQLEKASGLLAAIR